MLDFLSLDLELRHRWSDERRGWLPTVSVKNRGPALAQDATVAVRPAEPGPGISWGPYQLGDLEPGEIATRDLTGRVAGDTGPVLVVVGWRDRGGSHELPEVVEPPSPPAANSSRLS